MVWLILAAEIFLLLVIASMIGIAMANRQYAKVMIFLLLVLIVFSLHGAFNRPVPRQYASVIAEIDPEILGYTDIVQGKPLFGIFMTHSEAVGFYSPAMDLVYVNTEGMDVFDFELVLHHELGHRLWYRELTADEKRMFKVIHEFSKLKLLNESGFVSDYASTSVHEDFAESFAFIMVFDVEPRTELWQMRKDIVIGVLDRINASYETKMQLQ